MNSPEVSISRHELQPTLTSRASVMPLAGARPWRRVWHLLTATNRAPAAALARVGLALAIFPHGAQHALGWFGGYGFSGTLGWMTGTLGFPAWAAALAILTEIVAPVALLVGAASRLAALGIIGIMLGAISTHAPNGFFMNWFGGLPAGQEGFEYHLLVIVLCAVVVIAGGGALSLDRRLARMGETDQVR
jgi:putative oxidoreductase